MQILKPANFQGRLERVRLLRDYQGDALKAGRLLAGEEVELSHGDAEYLVVGDYAERLDAVPTTALGDVQPEAVVEAVAFGDEQEDVPEVVKPAPRKRAKKSEAVDEAN